MQEKHLVSQTSACTQQLRFKAYLLAFFFFSWGLRIVFDYGILEPFENKDLKTLSLKFFFWWPWHQVARSMKYISVWESLKKKITSLSNLSIKGVMGTFFMAKYKLHDQGFQCIMSSMPYCLKFISITFLLEISKNSISTVVKHNNYKNKMICLCKAASKNS